MEERRDATFCSMSTVSTVRMCNTTGYTLQCSAPDCLAIRLSPHAVSELLLPVEMKAEISMPLLTFPFKNKVRLMISTMLSSDT